jgi:hypothetical protein
MKLSQQQTTKITYLLPWSLHTILLHYHHTIHSHTGSVAKDVVWRMRCSLSSCVQTTLIARRRHFHKSINRLTFYNTVYLHTCFFFFVCDEGPSHHSLKAFCATPMMMIGGWAVFFTKLLMEHQWKESDRGKQKTRRKACPSATLSTTNLTWTWPRIEPGPPWWEAGD